MCRKNAFAPADYTRYLGMRCYAPPLRHEKGMDYVLELMQRLQRSRAVLMSAGEKMAVKTLRFQYLAADVAAAGYAAGARRPCDTADLAQKPEANHAGAGGQCAACALRECAHNAETGHAGVGGLCVEPTMQCRR